MPETGTIQPLQIQPRRDVLQPGDQGPRAIYPLRAQQAIYISQFPGGPSAISMVMRAVFPPRTLVIARPGGSRPPLALSSPLVQASGLVHARTLGAPKASPQLRLVGLVHTRVQGAPTVIPPPVIPPVIPPPTPPSVAPLTPRNLRSVARRNEPERD